MTFSPAPSANTRARSRAGVCSCRTANSAASCGPSAAPATANAATANAATSATGPPAAATGHAPACTSAPPHSTAPGAAARGSRAYSAVAALLEPLLADRTGPLRLTSHGGASPWHPHLDASDDAPWPEWFLASGCLAPAVLLWDRQAPPGRTCASARCGDVFVPHGSGPERRYCSRRCATRERVAAHRARTAAAPGAD
ncbi:CGNR zinc finger domain-containing protein [Streptomyces filamentosus]